MSSHACRAWLIAYDIADPRRLNRLHRFLARHAAPVQYSVYYYEGSRAAMEKLMKAIEALINPAKDDVRTYQLPDILQIDALGRGAMPVETMLLSDTFPPLQTLLKAMGK